MPDKVPLWIIKNTFCPYGSRMPERPKTMSPDLKVCLTCGKEMYDYKDWNWLNREYYCNTCIIDARRAENEAWAQRYGRAVTPINHSRAWREDTEESRVGFEYPVVPKNETEIPSGNLTENEYAFWIGNTERYSMGRKSLRAVCRGCSQIVFGDDGRSGHKQQSSTFYKGGLSCNKVLMLSYQQLLKMDMCMVCSNKCHGKQKWGVPLCCPNCIKLWKFSEDLEYESLERTMMQYWATLETRTETGGSITLASSLSQIPTVTQAAEEE